MKRKLLDTKMIEARLIEHAGKLLRWNNQSKIDRSTVLKAVNGYEKQKNFTPFEEFKKMPVEQRSLIWHAAQATLHNQLVQFAGPSYSHIYNKTKAAQDGKALFDELKKLAIPDTQESKTIARLKIEDFKMKQNESYEAATCRINELIIDYKKMGKDCKIEANRLAVIMTDKKKVNKIYHAKLDYIVMMKKNLGQPLEEDCRREQSDAYYTWLRKPSLRT